MRPADRVDHLRFGGPVEVLFGIDDDDRLGVVDGFDAVPDPRLEQAADRRRFTRVSRADRDVASGRRG